MSRNDANDAVVAQFFAEFPQPSVAKIVKERSQIRKLDIEPRHECNLPQGDAEDNLPEGDVHLASGLGVLAAGALAGGIIAKAPILHGKY
jgi:hypothetical protein